MTMKTSPNDISNKEILQELKKLSADVGIIKTDMRGLTDRVGGLETFAIETKEELKKLSKSDSEMKQELKQLSASDSEMKQELKKLSTSDSEMKRELKKLSDKMDASSNKMDASFASLEKSDQEILETMNSYATVVDDRLGKLEHGQIRMSANMVTKGYLDDKMADLRSDISHNTRRQIEKAIG